jgi:hypothetical protein
MKSAQTILLCPILLLMGLIISCSGKSQSRPSSASANVKTTPAGQPDIVILPGAEHFALFSCALTDKSGNIWLGTTGAGIYKYDGKLYTHFDKKDGLANTVIFSLLEDKAGIIWAGTADGVFCYNGKTFSRFAFKGVDGNFLLPVHSEGGPIPHPPKVGHVFKIIQDNTGNMWFSTEFFGLCKYDGTFFTYIQFTNGEWLELPKDTLCCNPGNRGFIQFLMKDRHGNIWISTEGTDGAGVFRYDGKSFKAFTPPGSKGIQVFNMMEDHLGNIWMTTRNHGVCRYDGKSIQSFTEKDLFCDEPGAKLLEDKKGNIWIGSIARITSPGACLSVYNGKSFSNFPTAELGNTAVIFPLLEDQKGDIWIGSAFMGLYRYDGKTLKKLSGK